MKATFLLPVAAMILASCATDTPNSRADEPVRGFEPPIVTNPAPAVEYPVALFEQQVEGVVLLHLFITEAGTIMPESTRIEQGSGYPELDSAALRGVGSLQFAPARNDGVPVATAFVQPVHFRHPELAAAGENR